MQSFAIILKIIAIDNVLQNWAFYCYYTMVRIPAKGLRLKGLSASKDAF